MHLKDARFWQGSERGVPIALPLATLTLLSEGPSAMLDVSSML